MFGVVQNYLEQNESTDNNLIDIAARCLLVRGW
jgi:hypothetical protein